jgi:hypothetical protein
LIGDLYVSTALGCVGIEGLFLDPEGPRDSPPHTTSKELRIRNMPAPKIILNDEDLLAEFVFTQAVQLVLVEAATREAVCPRKVLLAPPDFSGITVPLGLAT